MLGDTRKVHLAPVGGIGWREVTLNQITIQYLHRVYGNKTLRPHTITPHRVCCGAIDGRVSPVWTIEALSSDGYIGNYEIEGIQMSRPEKTQLIADVIGKNPDDPLVKAIIDEVYRRG